MCGLVTVHALCGSTLIFVPCVRKRTYVWCERPLCGMWMSAAHAMRDGHRQGSGTSEQGGSVKDLKPCSPTEETDRL